MGNRRPHQRRAERFKALQGAFDKRAYADLYVMLAFLRALHLVNAVLELPFKGTTHVSRQNAIKRHPRLRDIWSDYEELQNKSEIARYFAAEADDLPDKPVLIEHNALIADQQVARIEAVVMAIIAEKEEKEAAKAARREARQTPGSAAASRRRA